MRKEFPHCEFIISKKKNIGQAVIRTPTYRATFSKANYDTTYICKLNKIKMLDDRILIDPKFGNHFENANRKTFETEFRSTPNHRYYHKNKMSRKKAKKDWESMIL